MRTRLLLSVLAALAACGPDTDPTGPPASGDDDARLRMTAFVAGTPVATLVVEVSAVDIPQPLQFNLTSWDAATPAPPRGPWRTPMPPP